MPPTLYTTTEPRDLSDNTPTPPPAKRRFGLYALAILLVLLFVAFAYVRSLISAPINFPVGTPIEIVSGSGISTITKYLKEAGVVQSDLLLYTVLLSNYEPKDIKASTYYFDNPLDVFEVAKSLTQGDFDSNLTKFTHREGESVASIAKSAKNTITGFDDEVFLDLASTSEGYLFPETYLIPLNFSAKQLFTLMQSMYEKKVSPLRGLMAEKGLTEGDVIKMASIIEREANSVESMKVVAGILQNRLNKGMYLQVDASMEYVLGKPLKELTAEDLKMDSPYNTYKNFGLTPTPIGNPGLDAIMAVLEPTPSDYYFYITAKDGTFYYAKTFDGHRLNIAKYLR